MARRFTVLMSSAGRRVALLRIFREAMRSLGLDGRVIASDLVATAPAFHDADLGLLVPRVSAPDYVERTLALCREHAVDLVIPLIDPELPVLAAARPLFEAQGTEVHVGSPESVAIGEDKVKTHAWLVAAGIPTVTQAKVADVLAGADHEFPAIVKPSQGSCSVGVQRVNDRDGLRAATRTTPGGEWLIQSIAGGHEYTVDLYIDRNGTPRCAIPRRRLEVRGGEVSKAVTVRLQPVVDLAMAAAAALPGARGVVNVQIFHHPGSGELAMIELNPRFGGGYPLAWQAGARYPQWLIEEQLGLPSTITDRWEEGLAMLRFDDAVFRRVEALRL